MSEQKSAVVYGRGTQIYRRFRTIASSIRTLEERDLTSLLCGVPEGGSLLLWGCRNVVTFGGGGEGVVTFDSGGGGNKYLPDWGRGIVTFGAGVGEALLSGVG